VRVRWNRDLAIPPTERWNRRRSRQTAMALGCARAGGIVIWRSRLQRWDRRRSRQTAMALVCACGGNRDLAIPPTERWYRRRSRQTAMALGRARAGGIVIWRSRLLSAGTVGAVARLRWLWGG
jgi:hypothetical protein